MVEAIMLWNEPNNISHWDFKVDPDWKIFAQMIISASKEIRKINPELTIALGGMSPVDPNFVKLLGSYGVMDYIDVVAIHGFPLDWNHWSINEWPRKVEEIRSVTNKPVWVSEAGVSSFGAEEVQVFGIQRTAELLRPIVDRIHWYSLYDLPVTVTITWVCLRRTGLPSWRSLIFRRVLEFANGFISKTIGSMIRWNGFAGWA